MQSVALGSIPTPSDPFKDHFKKITLKVPLPETHKMPGEKGLSHESRNPQSRTRVHVKHRDKGGCSKNIRFLRKHSILFESQKNVTWRSPFQDPQRTSRSSDSPLLAQQRGNCS